MVDIEKAIRYYGKNPYWFFVDMLGFKECKLSREEYCAMTNQQKIIAKNKHDGEVTWQQKDILDVIPKAIEERKGISVRSGHGVGKTALESGIIIWWMTCFPHPKIPCTAPTQHQLYDILWSELSKWHKKSLVRDKFEWRKTHFWDKSDSENWFAVAQTSNKPDAMQGFHSEFLLFIIEEASGIPHDVMAVIEGTRTDDNALVMMFGNPTQISGAFHESFHGKRKFYYTFTLSCEESPRVHPDYYIEMADKYGKDSDIYRVRVLGEFPNAEPDTLIPIDRCEKAAEMEGDFPERKFWNDVELGVDVARYGDNETSIYSRVGNIIKEELIFREGRDLMYVVGQVVNIANKYRGKNIIINIDDSGLGGGVTDRLQELVKDGVLDATINGVNNGGSAKDKTRYINVGSEMWFFMREWIKEANIPNDNDLIGQLSTRRYSITSSGKHVVESKEHMRDRGIKSPDRADGAILTLRSLIYGYSTRGARAYAC